MKALLLILLLMANTTLAHEASSIVDLQALIDQQLAGGSRNVVIPAGEYRVVPKQQQHLVFSKLSDVEIDCTGVKLICKQTTRALTITDCRNVHLKGLTIDYDPLPFTQGAIVAMGPEKSWLEFEIAPGFPEHKLEQRIEIFDGKTRQLKAETRGDWQAFEKVGEHRYRVARGKNHKFDTAHDLEGIGDILVTNQADAPGGSAAHAVVCERCSGLVLEDVSVYASNCFAFLEESCDGSKYLRCTVDRIGERIRSSNADAFHFSNDAKGPSLIGCVARFQGDDAVNIHGQYALISACNGSELRVLGADKLVVGDSVELVSYTGERLPDAKVVRIANGGKIIDMEKTFLSKQRMDEGIRTHWNPNAFKITLDRPMNLPMGSILCSTGRMGNGFLIRDCDFDYNRSRGILIKASDGQIVHNKFVGNWMEAIEIAPEFWWLEAGSSDRVVVKDNTIRDCRTIGIGVYANGGSGAVSPAGAHRDLSIVGNKFVNCPLPEVVVTSTDGLIANGNEFSTSDAKAQAGKLRNLGLENESRQPMMLKNCSHVDSK